MNGGKKTLSRSATTKAAGFRRITLLRVRVEVVIRSSSIMRSFLPRRTLLYSQQVVFFSLPFTSKWNYCSNRDSALPLQVHCTKQ